MGAGVGVVGVGVRVGVGAGVGVGCGDWGCIGVTVRRYRNWPVEPKKISRLSEHRSGQYHVNQHHCPKTPSTFRAAVGHHKQQQKTQ